MKIAILIPSTSRNRNWKNIKESYLYQVTLKTYLTTTAHRNSSHEHYFYIGIDKDDSIYDNSNNQQEIQRLISIGKNCYLSFYYMNNIRKGHLTKMWNVLFQKAYDDNCQYFYQCGDDIEFKTKNWLEDGIDMLQKHDNIGITGPVNNNNFIITQSLVSRTHMEIFGNFFPEKIINWGCDDWYNEVYKPKYFYPLKKHMCVNIGGQERYEIDDITNFRKNYTTNVAKLRLRCETIAKNDRQKVAQYLAKQTNTPSSFCTLCTNLCNFELAGHLLSLAKCHPNSPVHIVADTETQKYIQDMSVQPKLNIRWHILLDKFTGLTRMMMDSQNIWSQFQMYKAKAIEIALSHHPDTLFLDSDTIIFQPIYLQKGDYKLGVSPQFITQTHIDKTGFYNGGMLWTNQKTLPNDWINFTQTSRYYDQASIEDLAKKYPHFEFDDSYNLQAWRFLLSPEGTNKIKSYITSDIYGIYYKNKPLRFIHTHFHDMRFRDFNQYLFNHLIASRNYSILAIINRIIQKEWVIKIPKQPLQGIGFHKNDSFRELAKLWSQKYKDIRLVESPDTIHCWIEPNILLYDRPTLEWCNQEISQSSIVLMGNGKKLEEQITLRNNGINVNSWIFWPRRPKLVERLLATTNILSYDSRKHNSIFIGNIENRVQQQHRSTDWSSVIDFFHITSGTTHKFTHEEYLGHVANSRYGLCLRGYGSKCHREVELMAFGTVPIFTPNVSRDYLASLIENTHFIIADSPRMVKDKIDKIGKKQWEIMSKACQQWFMDYCHSQGSWKFTIQNIIEGSI